jgi:peptidoglycan-associated lipoprotein
METIMHRYLTTMLLGGLLLLSACSSHPVKPEGSPVEDRTPTAATPPSTGSVSEPVGTQTVAQDPLKDPTNVLSKRSIYFDYDKYDIQDKYKPLIEAHARFLTANPGRKMLIQGNCDERGSREYNLALGQRRADAAKKALTLLGARETQIESVSLGEEKPRALGKDEASYAENRRDDMLYNGEY